MIVFGYVKDCKVDGHGSYTIQVRIPSIHGAYDKESYRGNKIRNYVEDNDLPYYTSLILPHVPNEGEVVALASMSENSKEFIVIGITGGFHTSNETET